MSVTLHLRIENQGLNRKVDLQFFAYSNNFFESLSKRLELPNPWKYFIPDPDLEEYEEELQNLFDSNRNLEEATKREDSLLNELGEWFLPDEAILLFQQYIDYFTTNSGEYEEHTLCPSTSLILEFQTITTALESAAKNNKRFRFIG